jgi:hypothetical protein
MSRKPDFRRLKEISLEQAIAFLTELPQPKREGRELRFPCPACGVDEKKRALAIHLTDGFTCWARGKKSGSDAVALVAHVRGISQTEAGLALEDHFFPAARAPSTAKAAPEGRRETSIPDSSDASHPVAEMLGLSATALHAMGAVEAERLVIPLRRADGTQIGTLGIATRADQQPLLAFDIDEEAAVPQKRGQDELRKLFRVVG